MACINIETAGTFSPSIVNSIGATGLIQFLPTTAQELGTTTAALKLMNNVQQLEYVKKYFVKKQSLLTKTNWNSFPEIYLTIFYPTARNKDDNYKFPSAVALQNPLFDKFPKDGVLTKGEVKKYLYTAYPFMKEIDEKKSSIKGTPRGPLNSALLFLFFFFVLVVFIIYI